MTNADTFGEWLKKRRKTLDLTQETLAERVGCSLSAIRKIENDARRPSRQVAELLLAALDVPTGERDRYLKFARSEGRLPFSGKESDPTVAFVAAPPTFTQPPTLPIPITPFVGRQQESESLARMLADPYRRLITILGPGGVGKTRLAIEAANAQIAAFDQQVYFIQLSAYNHSDAILSSIGAIFNFHSTSAEELITRLADSMLNKKVLLVLDNFEHLMAGALQVSKLLQSIPQLKVLVTSRERLNLQGEWTFELSGLSVPPKADEGKTPYSALQLFELHTQRIRPDLRLTGKEREAAIRICQRVDGIPLAIELAAAWVSVLSCEEIANEIEQGFDFLSSTLRDVPERHRSLRATFEYSWKRLTKQEQHVLSGLSIFQGGFRFEAAEAVVGAERSVLSSLVSKSFLHRAEDGRFSLHEVIRQYAGEGLKNESALRNNHSRYYLSLLQQREYAPIGAESDVDFLRELSNEYGNMRIAWEHAIHSKMYEDIDRVLDNSWLVYAINGWFNEGIQETRALVNVLRGNAESHEEKMLLARACMSVSGFLARAGDFLEADQFSNESVEILRSLEDIDYLTNELIAHSRVLATMGDYSRAHQHVEEGSELAKRGTNPWMFGLGYVNLGYLLGQEGEYEKAYEAFQSGLAIYKDLGNVHSMRAFALNGFAYVLIQMGRFNEAHEILQESLTLNTQFHDRWGMGTSLGRLGLLSLYKGELANAKTLLKRSLTLFSELGMRWDIAWVLTNLGKVAIASEEWQEAERTLRQSLKLAMVCHAMPQAIDAALELADCLLAERRPQLALEIVLHSLAHPASTAIARQRAEELLRSIQGQVPSDEIENLRAQIHSKAWVTLARQLV